MHGVWVMQPLAMGAFFVKIIKFQLIISLSFKKIQLTPDNSNLRFSPISFYCAWIRFDVSDARHNLGLEVPLRPNFDLLCNPFSMQVIQGSSISLFSFLLSDE